MKTLYLVILASLTHATFAHGLDRVQFIDQQVRPFEHRSIFRALEDLKKSNPSCYADRPCRIFTSRMEAADRDDAVAIALAKSSCAWDRADASLRGLRSGFNLRLRISALQKHKQTCAKQFDGRAARSRAFLDDTYRDGATRSQKKLAKKKPKPAERTILSRRVNRPLSPEITPSLDAAASGYGAL
jgi:hypothetical protein